VSIDGERLRVYIPPKKLLFGEAFTVCAQRERPMSTRFNDSILLGYATTGTRVVECRFRKAPPDLKREAAKCFFFCRIVGDPRAVLLCSLFANHGSR
jgi:hypothetical protein